MPIWLAGAIGLLYGFGVGLLAVFDAWSAAALAGLGGAAIVVAVARACREVHAPLFAILGVAYAGRLAILALLHYGLIAAGQRGYLFGDDATYADLAARVAAVWQGGSVTVDWVGEAYLLGSFVYLEAALFVVVGPHVEVPLVLNVLFAVALVGIVFALATRLFDRRAGYVAAALTAFYPSLTLWSVLNLKDALALFLLGTIVWTISRFATGPTHPRWLIVPFAALLVLEGVRRYLFLMLGVIVPTAVALAPSIAGWRRRIAYAITSFAVSGTLMAASGQGFLGADWLRPSTLDQFEQRRSGLAFGARTAFDDAPAAIARSFVARDGDTFLITDASSAGPQGPGGAVVYALPPTRLILGTPVPSALPLPPPGTSVISVSAGDLVVVAGASAYPTPRPSPFPLRLRPDGYDTVELRPEASLGRAVATASRLAAYLPKGLAYALAAPFPWDARTAADRLSVAEMLLWYPIAAAAAWQVWSSRGRWRTLFMLVALAGAELIVLALVEGNVGTLFRHRAMVMPFVFVLAAPSLVTAAGAIRKRVAIPWGPSRPPARP